MVVGATLHFTPDISLLHVHTYLIAMVVPWFRLPKIFGMATQQFQDAYFDIFIVP